MFDMFEIFNSLTLPGLVVVGLISIGFIIQIVALIDLVRSNFKQPNDKLIWAVIVIFLGFIGTILYFGYGTTQKIRK